MGLVERLFKKNVFLDTAPLIYFAEGHSQYHNKLLELFKANDKGDIYFHTSTLTILEVLVRPIKMNQLKLADQYEKILTTSPHIEIYDMDLDISKYAARLRASYNLKTPDAIQIATAIQRGADIFLTNDTELKRVSEVEILTLNDL